MAITWALSSSLAHAELVAPDLTSDTETAFAGSGDTALNDQLIVAELAAQQQEIAWSSPEADARRLASLTAFDDLPASSALAVAQSEFPAVLDHPLWQGPNLAPDEHIISYPDNFTARIGDSRHASYSLLDSSEPLRTTNAEGAVAPVSVDLLDNGSSFGPANAFVNTRMAKDLWGGISLGELGFSLRPSASPAFAVAQVADGKAFYANVDTDTDFLVGPKPAGVGTFFLLRSPNATESPELRFTLSAGQSLVANGAGAAVVDGNGTVASIQPPAATDALGEPVPASYVIAGDTLTVEVPHLSGSYAYPILVDPTVDGIVRDDEDNWKNFYPNIQPWGWSLKNPWPAYFTGAQQNDLYGYGLYEWPYIPSVPANLWVAWRYPAPANAFIYKATFVQQSAYQSNTCVSSGMVRIDSSLNEGAWEDAGSSCNTNINGLTSTYCIQGLCYPTVGDRNEAIYMVSTPGGGVSAKAYLAGAQIWLHDYNNPVLAQTGLVSGWFDPGQSAFTHAQITDAGLGVHDARLVVDDAPSSDPAHYQTRFQGCTGAAVNRCPTSWDPGFSDPSVGLPDGDHRVFMDAWDPVNNCTTCNTGYDGLNGLSIDRHKPTISVSGDLFDGREQYLGKTSYTLSVTADDSNPAAVQFDGTPDPDAVAGIGTFRVTIDGNTVAPLAGESCPRGSVSCTLDFTINPYTLPLAAGASFHHQVVITVNDALDTGTPHPADPVAGSASSFYFNSVLGTTTSPTGAWTTGKRLTLSATAGSGGLTAAKFQYNLDKTTIPTAKCDEQGANATWTDIPTAALRDARNGTLSSNSLTLTGGKTPVLTWDTASTITADGPLCVRPWFTGSTSGPGQVVRLSLDRSGPGSQRSSVPMGPGMLDPLTGNFRYEASDVQIAAPVSDLMVSRSFNSRSPATDGNSGPLGPGWELSLPVREADSEYKSIDASGLTLDAQTNKGNVILKLSDGGQIGFRRDLASYVPDPGYEKYSLSHLPTSAATTAAITDFVLKDAAGDQVDFQLSSGKEFRPVSIQQAAGGGTSSTALFSIVNGVARPLRALAPIPGDLSCSNALSSGTVPVGCRMLEFVYAPSSTTPPAAGQTGDYANHLKEIDLKAAVPSGSPPTSFSMQTTPVASYAYDSNGRLAAAWDPRISSSLSDCSPSPCQQLKETYTYYDNGADTSGRLKTITPAGLNAWSMTYTAVAPDASGGRLASVNRATPVQDGTTQTATTSVVYNVPLSGTAGPWSMGATSLDATGQIDIPRDATAIFPPDQIPSGSPPSDWSRATVYYLDAEGRTVNVAEPAPAGSVGRIRTTEYDSHGNAVRDLTAANRACALNSNCDTWAGTDSVAKARTLDTQRQYQSNNVDLADEWGPKHTIELADGTTALARRHLHNVYDYSRAPSTTTDYHLVTTSTVGAAASVVAGDLAGTVRTTAYRYGGAESGPGAVISTQKDIGWTLRKPTAVVTDSGGLNLVKATLYDSATGRVIETRMPRSQYGGDASATQSLYYVAGTNSSDSACGSSTNNRAGWDGLLCETRPAAQPTSSLPPIPSTVYEYSQLGLETKRTDTAGTSMRTWVTAYDGAGRESSYAVSSSVGTSLSTITYVFAQATGLAATDSDGTRTVSRGYDGVGRLISYTDGDGQGSTTTYDLLSRPVVTSDGKGSQTRTYDTTSDARGLLTRLVDSQAGTFNATYDDDGRLLSESYPNGVIACTSYDESGVATELLYRKSSDCAAGTVWLDDKQQSSIHGQWLHYENQQLSGASQDYTYDGAGRLLVTRDTVAGACTTRSYEYDNNGGAGNFNRTKLTTRVSASAICDTTSTGTVVNYAYDEADRESHLSYDAFGRTTAIPAAQGGTATSATYFANDRLASLTQGTTTRGYALDPAWRVRQRTASDTTTQTYHYSDDSDSPSWTQDKPTGANPPYTRNVEGIDGDLVALVVSGTTTLQFADLHGDVIATASTSTSATGPTSTMDADEFGVPRGSAASRYGWLGGKQRRTELATGAIAMGQRLYIPQLGRFAQVDPVPGGSGNAYDYANQDPLTQTDLDGRCATASASASVGCSKFKTVCSPGGTCMAVCEETKGGGGGLVAATLAAIALRYGGCVAAITWAICGEAAVKCIEDAPQHTVKCIGAVCAPALKKAIQWCIGRPKKPKKPKA